MRVLVVDSDLTECNAIAAHLRGARLSVEVAHDGGQGYRRSLASAFDVIVIDRSLPGVSGDEICRRHAARGSTARILLISDARSTADLVAGLELGADDYLAKPFDLRELTERVKALGRRLPPNTKRVLEAHDIVLDSVTRTAVRGNRTLSLPPRQYGILEGLLRAEGAVITGEALARYVWDKNPQHSATSLRTAMVGLRRALGEPNVIDTVFGVGYRIAGPVGARSADSAA